MHKLVKFWHPDGILYGASGDNEARELQPFSKIPHVLLDAHVGGGRRNPAFRVCCDNESIVRTAARELFAPGVEDFVFCGIRNRYAWTTARAKTYESLVRLHSGRFHVLWMPKDGSYDKRFLGALKAIPKPCGLLAVNDEVAAMLLGACSVAKIAVPKEVAVSSIDDDLLICENTKPTLTSVRLDHETGGFAGAELLDKVMSGRCRKPETIFYGPLMTMHRASTRLAIRTDASVAAAVEYIRSAIDRPLSVDDVAAQMKCSRRLAQLRFARSLGKSIGQVVGEVRLERVQFHLRQSGQPLGEIARLCGYSDESALRRFFRAATGVSMRDWRKQHES